MIKIRWALDTRYLPENFPRWLRLCIRYPFSFFVFGILLLKVATSSEITPIAGRIMI
ncbi:hypothetical protein [Leptospira ellisii]|uniref:hypothetical protein n=1 Tax=Leptospira ellisii TaxID=2023197 RepID=UPI0013FD36C5|nr:hypothetical protein [Leptospira ellisii]